MEVVKIMGKMPRLLLSGLLIGGMLWGCGGGGGGSSAPPPNNGTGGTGGTGGAGGGLAVSSSATGSSTVIPPQAKIVENAAVNSAIAAAHSNAQGNSAPPVVITMVMPKNFANPETGIIIAAGEMVPLWSYDTDTGVWTVHKDSGGALITGVVGDGDGDGLVDSPAAVDGNGDWLVAFPTNNLSYFNLDWFAWYQNVPGATSLQCSSTPLQVVGAQGEKIFFIAEAVAGGFSHEAYLDANPAAPAFENTTIWNAPTIPMRYTAYLGSKSTENKLNSQEFNNLCQPGGVTFNVDQSLLNSKLSTTQVPVE